jgi:nucleotide-binding universal stress UspA family protein
MHWTYPPRHILVPVDFGEASARALRVAGVLASRFEARVDALHADVLEAPPYFSSDQVSALEQQRAVARVFAEQYLEEFARASGVTLGKALVTDGPPHTAVLAHTDGVDLIVTGTHGRTGPSRWWLGSVAEKIVRETQVPVMVVRSSAEERLDDLFARVLVVSPFATDQGFSRRYALVLAAAFNGEAIDGTRGVTEESARAMQATTLAVPLRMSDRHWFGEQVERLLRHSEYPLLFVPDEGGRRGD